ncbi:MAG: glycosylhydrolase-like protein [Comamonadaceae bacterium]|nr:MAG: glycosylhydrolase-like protein [Comamonadaceae bacterium]
MIPRGWRIFLVFCLMAWNLSPATAQPLKAMGYLAWWMPQSWQTLPLQEIDRLFFFELKVDASGAISERHGWPEQWGELQQATQREKVPLDLTLTLFDSETFNRLFSSPQAVNKLLTDSLELAAHPNVSGLHLDFEIYGGASSKAITSYKAFLAQLSQQLRRLSPSRNLSVFLPVQTDDALYDAPSLGLMDWVVSQSYDAHYRSSKNAGPVAPLAGQDGLTWEKAMSDALGLGVPRNRLILTFPLYGYEWIVKDKQARSPTQQPGLTTTFSDVDKEFLPDVQISITQRVRQFGATHDPSSGSSYYQFQNEQGQQVQGWFEDWWSLSRKIDFVKAEKLGGLAFFVFGYDKEQLLGYYLYQKRPKSLIDLINLQ